MSVVGEYGVKGTGSSGGSEAAVFAQLYQRQAPFLKRYFLAQGAHRDDVADLIQDTFEVCWKKHNGVEPAKFAAYLKGIAQRALLAHYQKQARRRGIEERQRAAIIESIHTAGDSGSASEIAQKQRERLESLLDSLSADVAPIMRMRCLQEQTPQEIALALGISAKTVRNRISAGLAQLRLRLGRAQGLPPK